MTLIDLGDFKLRFDPKEVRISIDGEMIDVGARRNIEKEDNILPQTNKKFDIIGKDYFIDGKKQVKNSKETR